MQGLSATTGQLIAGTDHLSQSIRDILTTPIGTRVMRRDYGSRLFQLTDSPTNPAGLLALYAATADALARWEPRFDLTKVSLSGIEGGAVTLDLEGTADSGSTSLEVVL